MASLWISITFKWVCARQIKQKKWRCVLCNSIHGVVFCMKLDYLDILLQSPSCFNFLWGVHKVKGNYIGRDLIFQFKILHPLWKALQSTESKLVARINDSFRNVISISFPFFRQKFKNQKLEQNNRQALSKRMRYRFQVDVWFEFYCYLRTKEIR